MSKDNCSGPKGQTDVLIKYVLMFEQKVFQAIDPNFCNDSGPQAQGCIQCSDRERRRNANADISPVAWRILGYGFDSGSHRKKGLQASPRSFCMRRNLQWYLDTDLNLAHYSHMSQGIPWLTAR